MNETRSRFQVMGVLVLVQILFGINYVTSKAIVEVFDPLVWASFRNLICSVSLIGIAILSRRKAPPFKLNFLLPLAAYSLLGVVINQAAFLTGLKYTTATNSSVLNTLIPVFTLLFVTISGQEPLTGRRTFGFIAALGGVLVIRKVEDFTLSNQTLLGDSLVILNCASYGLFLTLGRTFIQRYDSLWITGCLFSVGTLGLGAIGLPNWLAFSWPTMTPNLLACMVFSIFGSTLLAYFLNNWALARTRSSLVALFVYLQPLVATSLAWGWLGETPTFRTFMASLLILIGMLSAFGN